MCLNVRRFPPPSSRIYLLHYNTFSNILFIKWYIWLGKASLCDPNVFSSSYLPALVICRLLFTNKNVGRILKKKNQCVQSAYYSISVRLTVILTVDKPTSECHLSKETNTMYIIQMVQEQHAIYFGYAFFRRFRLILQEL